MVHNGLLPKNLCRYCSYGVAFLKVRSDCEMESVEAKLDGVLYGNSSGAYSGFAKFFHAVKSSHPEISEKKAKNYYKKQTVNQVLKLWYPKRIQRSYLISGLQNYFTFDAFYIKKDHGLDLFRLVFVSASV